MHILNFLTEQEAKDATDYVLNKENSNELVHEAPHPFGKENVNTYRLYQDKVFNDISLNIIKPKMEEILDTELYPTYTYTRLYKPGYILRPHRDRESCDLSSTITVGYGERETPWEISLEDDDGNEIEHVLESGWGLMYEGTKYNHWRYRLDHGWQLQTFAHFLRVGGDVYNELLKRKPDFNSKILFQDIRFKGNDEVEIAKD